MCVCFIIVIWRVHSLFQLYGQFYLKLCVPHTSFCLHNFSNCYVQHRSNHLSPTFGQQPHWSPMLTLAISLLFSFSTQPLEWSFENIASCSKSLCVWLISEQRSCLIPQALFLLTSESFQVPSQQHNWLHCSFYLSAFRKM